MIEVEEKLDQSHQKHDLNHDYDPHEHQHRDHQDDRDLVVMTREQVESAIWW